MDRSEFRHPPACVSNRIGAMLVPSCAECLGAHALHFGVNPLLEAPRTDSHFVGGATACSGHLDTDLAAGPVCPL